MKARVISILLILNMFSVSVIADTGWVKAKVTDIIISENDYGGCLVKLNKNTNESGVNCHSEWVSFSCNGVYNAKDVAYRMLDVAQASMLMGNFAWAKVESAEKVGTYCTAKSFHLTSAQ